MDIATSPTRHIEYCPLDDIPGTEDNPKGHDLPVLIRAIGTLGFTAPAVIDERTGHLIVGNGRLEALRIIRDWVAGEDDPEHATVFKDQRLYKALTDDDERRRPPDGVMVDGGGVWHAPVVRGWASRNDEQARAAVVADNRLTEKGGWDDRLLAEWLDEILDYDPDLLGVTGFSTDELDDLKAAFDEPPSLDDLADEYGEPADSDLWPVLRFQVPPAIRNSFYDLTGDSTSTDDSARFIHLINKLQVDT